VKRAVIAVLSLALLAACGTEPRALEGTYVLRSVDGVTVPVILYEDETEKDELLSGEVQLRDDGTFTDITAMRLTVNEEVRVDIIEAQGTWSQDGSDVVFQMSNGGTYRMSFSSNTLTQDWYGYLLSYHR
jgi:hypothetical protein